MVPRYGVRKLHDIAVAALICTVTPRTIAALVGSLASSAAGHLQLKTHLAVAIAYRAIQNGFDAFFTTAAQIIEDPSNASQHGRLHKALPASTHHVLVVDEVGYLSYGSDAANVLYHVVNDRHLRKRPMIFTTN